MIYSIIEGGLVDFVVETKPHTQTLRLRKAEKIDQIAKVVITYFQMGLENLPDQLSPPANSHAFIYHLQNKKHIISKLNPASFYYLQTRVVWWNLRLLNRCKKSLSVLLKNTAGLNIPANQLDLVNCSCVSRR